MAPSRQIGDMIQNLDLAIHTGVVLHESRAQFIDIIARLTDPAIIRSTIRVCFFLYYQCHHFHHAPLEFFLRGLNRLSNFQVVKVKVVHLGESDPDGPPLTTDKHYKIIEHALRLVLGPARPRVIGQSLTFLPQQFLNALRSQENFDFGDHFNRIRLYWNGDRTKADRIAGESELLAQNSGSQS